MFEWIHHFFELVFRKALRRVEDYVAALIIGFGRYTILSSKSNQYFEFFSLKLTFIGNNLQIHQLLFRQVLQDVRQGRKRREQG